MPGIRIGLVADLWRYPVKSFGGERSRRLFVGPYGIHGDRTHAVVNARGAVVTVRRNSRMLGFGARHADAEATRDVRIATPDGEELPVDDPALEALLTGELGQEARLARSPVGVFDAAALHIVTDASVRRVAEWTGRELTTRRFRPNVVVELELPDPFTEAGWIGGHLAIGESAVAGIVSLTERCAVTTLDPDTLERDDTVLATLANRLDNLFGAYAQVARPGWVHVGDPVVLHPPPAAPSG
ncbi:MAG: MOSC domain-containing protein [Thermoleophilia bacterium]|nr:MOSC domain-containing protein [Thermoleophilia bacterium]